MRWEVTVSDKDTLGLIVLICMLYVAVWIFWFLWFYGDITYTRSRRARGMLWSFIWPIATVFYIVYGLVKLFIAIVKGFTNLFKEAFPRSH